MDWSIATWLASRRKDVDTADLRGAERARSDSDHSSREYFGMSSEHGPVCRVADQKISTAQQCFQELRRRPAQVDDFGA